MLLVSQIDLLTEALLKVDDFVVHKVLVDFHFFFEIAHLTLVYQLQNSWRSLFDCFDWVFLQWQDFFTDLGFEVSITYVVNFLSLAVQRLCVLLNELQILDRTLHEWVDRVEFVGCVQRPNTVGANPEVALVTEVFKLASVKTAKDWDNWLRCQRCRSSSTVKWPILNALEWREWGDVVGDIHLLRRKERLLHVGSLVHGVEHPLVRRLSASSAHVSAIHRVETHHLVVVHLLHRLGLHLLKRLSWWRPSKRRNSLDSVKLARRDSHSWLQLQTLGQGVVVVSHRLRGQLRPGWRLNVERHRGPFKPFLLRVSDLGISKHVLPRESAAHELVALLLQNVGLLLSE